MTLAVLLSSGVALVSSEGPEVSAQAQEQTQEKPNIVLIVADDMRADQLAYMPRTLSLLGGEGITFENAYATTPVCCPSRASILTGKYTHNHRVLTNRRGFQTFRSSGAETETVAAKLDAAGYSTVLVGKYLNGYSAENAGHIPPGWDEWYAKLGVNTPYYDYSLSENGRIVRYGSTVEDYRTDVEAGKAIDFIHRAADDPEPLFVYLAPSSPHAPYVPAPRHQGMFAGTGAPRPPSFDEANVLDKPGWVRNKERLSARRERDIDRTYRTQLEMLQSLDEYVAGVVDELAATGRLEDTYIFFISDNGLHAGEHRIPGGKGTAYEESIRVPLVARGPGIAPGTTEERIALNIDLAPTAAELASLGVDALDADGRSLAPLLSGASSEATPWRSAFLEESWGGQQIPTHKSVVTPQGYKYVEYANGARELYDLRTDPYELENVYRSADPALKAELQSYLNALKGCDGQACWNAENAS